MPTTLQFTHTQSAHPNYSYTCIVLYVLYTAITNGEEGKSG